jgi:hypothetical protein
MPITATKYTNQCFLKSAEAEYSTTICPEEFGGMDSYIEQTEGWKPACARVFLTKAQWEALPAGVRGGTVAVGIGISGNAGIPDDNRTEVIVGDTADIRFTEQIFFVWRVNTQKSGTTTALYEVEFRTQQQWWDAIRVTKAWNCLNAAGTALVAEEGASAVITSWSDILTQLWTVSGITPVAPTVGGSVPVYYTPLNLRLRGTPFSVALRRVLDVARCSLSHDLYTDTFAVNPNGANTFPSASFSANYLLNGDKAALVGLPGDVMPTSVVCYFPKVAGGYDTETKTAASFGGTATGTGGQMPLHVGDYSDATLAAGISGLATQTNVADDLARAVILNAKVTRRRYLVPGHAWPAAIGDQTLALGWSMHPSIRYRKVSLCGVRAGDMSPGLTTYVETGPILYPEAELHRINSPVVGGEVAVRWRPDGTVDVAVPVEDKTLYRVSANSSVVADRKWTYTLTPQRLKASITVGTASIWEDVPGGTTLLLAVNIAEDRNTAGSTLQGNDVDFSLDPFGTTAGTLARKLQPIKTNRLVKVDGYFTDGSDVVHAYFDAANIVQEPCIS